MPKSANPTSQQFTQGDNLQITLTAMDNKDPAPVIYYTTDGTIPTAPAAHGNREHLEGNTAKIDP